MQDEFNNGQPENEGFSPPNVSELTPNNAINQSGIPLERRVLEPINSNIKPDPVIDNNQAQTVFNGPIQKAPTQYQELNPLNQGAGLAPKKSNKKLIALVVSALVVVLLGGGAFAAYAWYQSPQKVVTDSLINAITAKTSIYTGNITIDSSGTKVAVDIKANADSNNAKSSLDASIKITYNEKDIQADGSVIYGSKGDIYFKVKGLKEAADQYLASAGVTNDSSYAGINSAVDKLVGRIDGVWIKVSSDDLKEYSKSYATTNTCLNTAIDKFKSDKKAISEVTDLYAKNQFIAVEKELGQKDGSSGYQIKGDQTKLKSFAKGLESTTIYKSLHDCDKSFTINADDMDISKTDSSDTKTTVELWVNTWSHKTTKLVGSVKPTGDSSSKDSASFTLNTDYDSKVDISIPSDSISLSKLKTYIEEFMTSMNQN